MGSLGTHYFYIIWLPLRERQYAVVLQWLGCGQSRGLKAKATTLTAKAKADIFVASGQGQGQGLTLLVMKLQIRHFYTVWFISWSDFHEYFTTNVASDKEVPATFGKLTEIGVQIYALVVLLLPPPRRLVL